MKLVKNIFIYGPAGKLEAIFNPQDNPAFLAVVCHPHPLFEGTMHNKVVVTAAKTLSALGGAVLRFNFRGVMQSEGKYAEGIGEAEDVKAAIDFLKSEYPASNVPVIVCGFSFGAWVGLKYSAKDDRVQYLIGLGLPMRMFDTTVLKESKKPKLLIWGEEDELIPIQDALRQAEEIAEPKTVRTVP
ncbi:MAG: hypothetical protein HGB19_01470, partial [Chlorobiales bacterium]|nr:hypothetical protein [Chlorobiales bacterium]